MSGAFGTLRAVKRIKRLSEDHPWLGEASVRLDAAFNNPDLQSLNLFIEYLQTRANDDVRSTVADQHAHHLENYARADDTGAELRDAVVQLVESYAPMLVLFTEAAKEDRFDGMYEHVNKLLPLYFQPFHDPEKTLPEILRGMHTTMERYGFDYLLKFKFKEAFDAQDDFDGMQQLLINACRYHSVAMQQTLGLKGDAEVSRASDINREAQQDFFEGQMGLLSEMA